MKTRIRLNSEKNVKFDSISNAKSILDPSTARGQAVQFDVEYDGGRDRAQNAQAPGDITPPISFAGVVVS